MSLPSSPVPHAGPAGPSAPWARWDHAIGALVLFFLFTYSYDPLDLVPGAPTLIVPWRLALAALAALVVIRHIRYPRPTLAHTFVGGAVRRLMPGGSPFAVTVAVVTRVAVIAMALHAATTGAGIDPRSPMLSQDPFWNLPARWDVFWFLDISNSGYRWDPAHLTSQFNVAFFPAFPVLMRLAGNVITMPAYLLHDDTLFGGTADTRIVTGGWLAGMLAFTWGLSVVYELAREDVGRTRAAWAVLLLACFPFSVFYSAPYTEGLFLLAVASAFLRARRGQAVAVFFWGALAALTRQTGVVMCLPLALIAWNAGRVADGSIEDAAAAKARRTRLLAASLGPIAGLSIHVAHLWWKFGDPWVWVKAQEGWKHSVDAIPFIAERVNALRGLGLAEYVHRFPGPALGTLIPFFALFLLWRTWRLSRAYALFIVIMLAPAVAMDIPSLGRIGSTLFPLFIALAALLPDRPTAWTTAILFGLGQLWAATVFFTWGRLY